MKISNKEKVMLCILGIIVISFVYYQFVYSYQTKTIEEKTKQESELEKKYTTANNTINSIEDKKIDVKILKAKVNDESLAFYPTISEEHIILELDTLLKDSELDGGIKFNSIVSDSVESVDKKSQTLAESSLQGIVDQYNGINEDSDVSDTENNNVALNNNNKTSTKDNSNSSNTKKSTSTDTKGKKKNTVQYVKVEVDFEGNYEGLNKLLNTIEKNEKKIVVNSIKIDEDTLEGVKGTINLEIYSVPKITDDLKEYLNWDLNNTYGKSMPFGSGAESSNVAQSKNSKSVQFSTGTTGVSEQEVKEISNFIALVKPTASDLPTIMMGKANDKLRSTYVYGDSNSEENVEMILTQDGDKYYYKYKTSKGTFPENYDEIGAEFVPISNNIVLNILSQIRIDANDNSGMKLKIINETDKLVEVNISGDDSSNPRVIVDGDGSNISVNKS